MLYSLYILLACRHKSNPCCVNTFFDYTLKFPYSTTHCKLIVMPQGKAFNPPTHWDRSIAIYCIVKGEKFIYQLSDRFHGKVET